MKKEDILEKARAEKSDEREKFIRDRSALWTVGAMAVAVGFFAVMRGEDAPISDLIAIIDFSMMVCFIYRYVKLKQIWYLAVAILMAAFTAFFVVRYFQGL